MASVVVGGGGALRVALRQAESFGQSGGYHGADNAKAPHERLLRHSEQGARQSLTRRSGTAALRRCRLPAILRIVAAAGTDEDDFDFRVAGLTILAPVKTVLPRL